MCLVSGDFWLGLEKIHHLVQEGRYSLLIELEDWEGNSQVVQFVFSLGGESTAYMLNLLGPLSGELENAIGDFRQLPFSTRDRDHDLKADTNCAKHLSGQYELFLPSGMHFPFSPLLSAGGCEWDSDPAGPDPFGVEPGLSPASLGKLRPWEELCRELGGKLKPGGVHDSGLGPSICLHNSFAGCHLAWKPFKQSGGQSPGLRWGC